MLRFTTLSLCERATRWRLSRPNTTHTNPFLFSHLFLFSSPPNSVDEFMTFFSTTLIERTDEGTRQSVKVRCCCCCNIPALYLYSLSNHLVYIRRSFLFSLAISILFRRKPTCAMFTAGKTKWPALSSQMKSTPSASHLQSLAKSLMNSNRLIRQQPGAVEGKPTRLLPHHTSLFQFHSGLFFLETRCRHLTPPVHALDHSHSRNYRRCCRNIRIQ